MMTPIFRPLTIASLALALAACAKADTSRYPSLAIRDVERITGSGQPVTVASTPAGPVAPDADLAGRLTRLRTQADEAQGNFAGGLARAEQLIADASGSAVASENWSVALAALAGLEAARNPGLIALAELDELYVRSELDAGAAEAVLSTRNDVQAQAQRQQETIDRLAARLPMQ